MELSYRWMSQLRPSIWGGGWGGEARVGAVVGPSPFLPSSPPPPPRPPPPAHLVLAHRPVLDDARLHGEPVPDVGRRVLVGEQRVVLGRFRRPAVAPPRLGRRAARGGGGHKVLEDVGLLEQELHALLEARFLGAARGAGRGVGGRPAARAPAPPAPPRSMHPATRSPTPTSSAANAVSSSALILASSVLRAFLTRRMRSRSRLATSRRASLERAAWEGGWRGRWDRARRSPSIGAARRGRARARRAGHRPPRRARCHCRLRAVGRAAAHARGAARRAPFHAPLPPLLP